MEGQKLYIETITALGWALSIIGILVVALCIIVWWLIVKTWNKSESTSEKLEHHIGEHESDKEG